MPAQPPEGCLTRPEAAKQFNRSQRALERDLNLAVSVGDAAVLDHWFLVTKDGALRRGADVETDEVKKLVTDGMTPTWYVEELWLDQEYGRKGIDQPSPVSSSPLPASGPEPTESEQSPDSTPEPPRAAPCSTDIEFLLERIRGLEREKREEATRAENREARLFDQLAVKDRQINSWDEITQGLTRGLATGQLVLKTATETAPDRSTTDAVRSTSASVPAVSVVEKKPRAKRRQPKKKKKKKNAVARPKVRTKPAPPKNAFEKHTPTFYNVASRLFRRS